MSTGRGEALKQAAVRAPCQRPPSATIKKPGATLEALTQPNPAPGPNMTDHHLAAALKQLKLAAEANADANLIAAIKSLVAWAQAKDEAATGGRPLRR